jgi:hypothetical protein
VIAAPAAPSLGGWGDRGRLFLTAWLVYAVFVNPLLASPITWSSLDAAVSLVETGRWQVTHGALYGDMDVARAGERSVLGPPPGLAVALVPLYLVWRAALGPVEGPGAFGAFHVFATLVLGASVSALLAGEVAALAGWFGASRAGRLWAALLFAFGTPAFLFATRLFKENLAALAVIVAVRLAVADGGPARRVLAGFVAGLAALVAYPAGLIAAGLAVLLGARAGRRGFVAFTLGWLPSLTALALYNTWLFGRPWRFAYATYLNLPEAVPSVGWQSPDAVVLLNSLLHPREGLLLYSPFLVLGLIGLGVAWRGGRRLPVAVIALYALALWALSAAWLARFPSSFTGARYLFAAVPLLAACAGPVLERTAGGVRAGLAVVSVGLTYLVVQAGHIADPAPLLYALKTFVSGGGMPVLLKETLPTALGLETLHTTLARADVGAGDLPALLATVAGRRLVLNQAVLGAAGVLVLAAIAWVVGRLWARPAPAIVAAPPVPVS